MRPTPLPHYTPSNWYWIVAGSTTQVYSSAVGNFVAITDPTFLAWLASGHAPTNIDTEANLGQVLAGQLLRPVPANVLDGYKDSLAANIVTQVIFKILFNHENRLRACERALALNGSPPDLTANQAKAAVKALM